MATEQKWVGSLRSYSSDHISDEIEKRKGYFPRTSRYAWSGKTNDENFRSCKPFRKLFLFRNRPHTQQARHIKGLLDVPVCVILGNTLQPFDKVVSSSDYWNTRATDNKWYY